MWRAACGGQAPSHPTFAETRCSIPAPAQFSRFLSLFRIFTHPRKQPTMNHPDILRLVDDALQNGKPFSGKQAARIRIRRTCKEIHEALPRLKQLDARRVRDFQALLLKSKARWGTPRANFVRESGAERPRGKPEIASCRYHSIISEHVPWALCRHLLPCGTLFRCPRCEFADTNPLYEMLYRAQDVLMGPAYYLFTSAFCANFLREGCLSAGYRRWLLRWGWR
jgi:hypothetical protein